ncbi:MAG: TonB family protein [Gammaproteobacteria bacterium]|nr:MAG: TonB family protein [Gammaproteobacteria bacterium]
MHYINKKVIKFKMIFTIFTISTINEVLAEDGASTSTLDIPYNVNNSYWVPKGPFPVKYNQLNKYEPGCVLLKFIINESGEVANPQVIKSYPTEVLNKVALDAALKYKFKPTKINLDRKSMKSVFVFTYSGFRSGRVENIGEKCMENIN